MAWCTNLLEAAMILVATASTIAAMAADSVPAAAAGGIARLSLLAALFYALIGHCLGASDADAQFAPARAVARALGAWAATVLFLAAMCLLLRSRVDVPHGWILAWAAVAAGLITLSRTTVVVSARRLRKRGVFDQRCAIFGCGGRADALARYLAEHEWLTISLVGFYEDPQPRQAEATTPLPVRGGSTELIAAIRAGHVDQVIIALEGSEEGRMAAIAEALSLTPVRVRQAPDLTLTAGGRRNLVLLGAMPLMTVADRPVRGIDRLIKAMIDRGLALSILLAASPLLILVAIAIRLDTRGPIFFRQPREGFNCRTFEIWKFRSMHVEHCATDDIVQARHRDARVTRVGSFLRRTSLDELPQIINVLLGHMSLVGPRPHAKSTRAGSKLFSELVATYAARHRVKPGMTGWAQVCGWRGETDTEHKLVKRLEHDLYYIEHWSILFDFYILARTAPTLLFQRAY